MPLLAGVQKVHYDATKIRHENQKQPEVRHHTSLELGFMCCKRSDGLGVV